MSDNSQLRISEALQRVSYLAVYAEISKAIPKIDPVWAQSAAQLQVYGADAGLSPKETESSLAVLAAVNMVLSGAATVVLDEATAYLHSPEYARLQSAMRDEATAAYFNGPWRKEMQSIMQISQQVGSGETHSG